MCFSPLLFLLSSPLLNHSRLLECSFLHSHTAMQKEYRRQGKEKQNPTWWLSGQQDGAAGWCHCVPGSVGDKGQVQALGGGTTPKTPGIKGR